MADGYDRAQRAAKDPQGHIMAQRLKILAGTGAMANAVDPNPLVGLMDMALMVTLTRQIAQDPWAGEVFGPESARAILATLKEAQPRSRSQAACSDLSRLIRFTGSIRPSGKSPSRACWRSGCSSTSGTC
jgi:hypothetical protein